MFYAGLKRACDFIIALLALILCAPLFLLLAIIIKATSPGPVFFRQIRVGRDGKFFYCLKFRSMKTTAPQSPTSELRHADFYITRVGAFLRRCSLDELPQLFNILKGDMSLIGPRPLIPAELTVHDLRSQYHVYQVRPGLTGWAQIHGRDTISAVRKAKLDRYYVEHFGLKMDLKILLKSAISVLRQNDVAEGEDHVAGGPKQSLRARFRAVYNRGSMLVTLHSSIKKALPRIAPASVAACSKSKSKKTA